MIVALAVTIVAGIALPHALRLQAVAPPAAIALWLSSLALRAFGSALVMVYMLLYLPRTRAFDALTHWCSDAYLPLITGEHGLDGHSAGDLLVLIPAVLLALSLLWVSVAIVRATRAARRLIERHALGQGPRGSLIVGGPDIVFAVAGIARPRIVVSAGALTSLDDDELAAGLDHEQAHIARHHRFVMLLATGFRALGRFVPGSRCALGELAFQLERDADRWALRRRHDRLALARVISKAAALGRSVDHVAMAGLGDAGVRRRVDQLLDQDRSPSRRRSRAVLLNGLAAAMVASTLLLAAAVPAAAVAGVESDAHRNHHEHRC